MKKLKLKINGMNCISCALNIDGELESTKGIRRSHTSYNSSQTTIEYEETQLSQQKIVQLFSKLGYQVSPI